MIPRRARGRLQNRVFAPESALGDLDGEKRTERDPEAFALAPVGDGGPSEALGGAEYHLVLEYKMWGPLTALSGPTHCKRLAGVAVDRVLLNLSHVTRIDLDGVKALEVRSRRRGGAAGGCGVGAAFPELGTGGIRSRVRCSATE